MNTQSIHKSLAGVAASATSMLMLAHTASMIQLSHLQQIMAIGWVVSYFFAFLWLRSRVMLIGLSFICLYANLQILYVPNMDVRFIKAYPETTESIGIIMFLLSLASLIMAMWPQFYPEFLTKKSRQHVLKGLLVILLSFTLIQSTVNLL